MSRLILALVFCFISSVSFANKKCASILPRDATTNLIGYLGSMVEQGFVGAEGLQSLKGSIAGGQLVNPISSKQASGQAVLELHRNGIAGLLNEQIDADQLSDWLETSLKNIKANQHSQSKVTQATQIPALSLSFVKIPKGSFWSGPQKSVARARELSLAGVSPAEVLKKIEAEHLMMPTHMRLLQDYEVSSTVITQQHWYEVMGRLPEDVFTDEFHNVKTAKGKSYSPDHPMTDVTFWSMLVFANKYSQSKGLEPVFIFDESRFDTREGSFEEQAAKGELRYITILDNDLDNFKMPIQINSKNGSYYGSEGYRLPTHFEMEYLGRYGQVEYTNFHFGDVSPDSIQLELAKYMWLEGKVMPVALKKPLVIDGHGAIFDYHGNINEALFQWKIPLKEMWDIINNEFLDNPESKLSDFSAGGQIGTFGASSNNRMYNDFSTSRRGATSHQHPLPSAFRLVRSLP